MTKVAAAADVAGVGKAHGGPRVDVVRVYAPHSLASAAFVEPTSLPRTPRLPQTNLPSVGTVLELAAWSALVVGLAQRNPQLRRVQALTYGYLGVQLAFATLSSLRRVRSSGELHPLDELQYIPQAFRDQIVFNAKVCAFYLPLVGCLGGCLWLSISALTASPTVRPAAPTGGGAHAPASRAAHPLLPELGSESCEEDAARIRARLHDW